MYFDDLYKELSNLEEVEAIALGGSRAGENYDEKSDYDLYVYVRSLPDIKVRKGILEKYCSYIEINNTFWETEDDSILKDGIPIDIIYRSLKDFSSSLYSTLVECNASNGYTTCMWYNLLNSKILFDRNGECLKLQKEFSLPYPEKLRENIIKKNRALLSGMLPSYDDQIRKAFSRADLVSINHRTSAFIESYFDIIFALNKLPHPGEKRMVLYAKRYATLIPSNFEENLSALFTNLFIDQAKALKALEDIIRELDILLNNSL